MTIINEGMNLSSGETVMHVYMCVLFDICDIPVPEKYPVCVIVTLIVVIIMRYKDDGK